MSSTWTSVPWVETKHTRLQNTPGCDLFSGYETSSSPCVCDRRFRRRWSAGWHSAETSPFRCAWGRWEPLRSSPHPPPRSWVKSRHPFGFRATTPSTQRRRPQTLTGSWGSASSLFRCTKTWRWWAGDPAGRWGCREGSGNWCRGYWGRS